MEGTLNLPRRVLLLLLIILSVLVRHNGITISGCRSFTPPCLSVYTGTPFPANGYVAPNYGFLRWGYDNVISKTGGGNFKVEGIKDALLSNNDIRKRYPYQLMTFRYFLLKKVIRILRTKKLSPSPCPIPPIN